jgi:hypothetical protein
VSCASSALFVPSQVSLTHMHTCLPPPPRRRRRHQWISWCGAEALYRFGDLFTRCGPLNAFCHRLVVLVLVSPLLGMIQTKGLTCCRQRAVVSWAVFTWNSLSTHSSVTHHHHHLKHNINNILAWLGAGVQQCYAWAASQSTAAAASSPPG